MKKKLLKITVVDRKKVKSDVSEMIGRSKCGTSTHETLACSPSMDIVFLYPHSPVPQTIPQRRQINPDMEH
ncbi:unnamed protein product [Arabis nemorensis]|uniref:Uncharacterized protein n=1 Tax=Arabis nemorensis TaxID=586526 RepID=A0A565C984_9BRAS|nr:unnamed protein product [Arabis nemorensis]